MLLSNAWNIVTNVFIYMNKWFYCMFIKLSLYLVQLLIFNKPINCTNNILSMMCKIYLFEYKFTDRKSNVFRRKIDKKGTLVLHKELNISFNCISSLSYYLCSQAKYLIDYSFALQSNKSNFYEDWLPINYFDNSFNQWIRINLQL